MSLIHVKYIAGTKLNIGREGERRLQGRGTGTERVHTCGHETRMQSVAYAEHKAACA